MKYITPSHHRDSRISVHPSQRQPHIEPVSSPLYVVTAITNPERFRTRYELYRAFEKMCADSGAILYTIELALRDRHHEITDPDNPRHIQLRSPDILFNKENLLNIAIRALPASAEYIAWVDADVEFARKDWVVETIHQLQKYRVVQMWTHAMDLGPNREPVDAGFRQYSFIHSHLRGLPFPGNQRAGSGSGGNRIPGLPGGYWHSGYAWAARRSALSDLGGLGEAGILGSGDRHMAAALIGMVGKTIDSRLHPSYKHYWDRWQRRADLHVNGNVGVVPGLLLHYWHGAKRNRRYIDRWQILLQTQFDWNEDVYVDFQGVLQLSGNKPRLRDLIQQYFESRDEDSSSL
jgi:hypothetical protein